MTEDKTLVTFNMPLFLSLICVSIGFTIFFFLKMDGAGDIQADPNFNAETAKSVSDEALEKHLEKEYNYLLLHIQFDAEDGDKSMTRRIHESHKPRLKALGYTVTEDEDGLTKVSWE